MDKEGIGVSGVLLLIFIVLKLTGLISWSWVWVLAPLWIPIGLFVLGMGLAFIYFLLTLNNRL